MDKKDQEEVSLAEAICEGKHIAEQIEQLGWLKLMGWAVPIFRRLIEAGEFEEDWGDVNECLDRWKTTCREKDRQIQALRRQLDDLGKEKESELELANKVAVEIGKELNTVRFQLAEKKRELERLRGMLDRLLEQSDPPEKAAPTEAEVEKVREKEQDGLALEILEIVDEDEKSTLTALSALRISAHVLERGYRTKEDDTIEDGFGGCWSVWCSFCGKKSVKIVRPGKAQCPDCG